MVVNMTIILFLTDRNFKPWLSFRHFLSTYTWNKYFIKRVNRNALFLSNKSQLWARCLSDINQLQQLHWICELSYQVIQTLPH